MEVLIKEVSLRIDWPLALFAALCIWPTYRVGQRLTRAASKRLWPAATDLPAIDCGRVPPAIEDLREPPHVIN